MGGCLAKPDEDSSLHALNDSVHVMRNRAAKKNDGSTQAYKPREVHPSIVVSQEVKPENETKQLNATDHIAPSEASEVNSNSANP